MKHQHITALVVLAVSSFVVRVVPAGQAQDRFTLKSPNGIAFSEFKGYDAWQTMAVAQADPDGCLVDPCVKTILGNAAMIKAGSDGVPANGQPVPDGAAMAKIEWSMKNNSASPYTVNVPDRLKRVSFMMKDSKRFPDTDGWGYAEMRYDAASDTFKPFGNSPVFGKTCHACHTAVKDRDFVFTNYAKR